MFVPYLVGVMSEKNSAMQNVPLPTMAVILKKL